MKFSKVKIWRHIIPNVHNAGFKILDEIQYHAFQIRPGLLKISILF